jgi:O-acetyl-ADP-ribose deacetylase (regulator of RNase III)
LKLADMHAIQSIAFPALSTGIFGYPVGEAAQVAFDAILEYLKGDTHIEIVRMVLYDEAAHQIHIDYLDHWEHRA